MNEDRVVWRSAVVMSVLLGAGAALVGPLGLIFGLAKGSWYRTCQERAMKLAMHVLPGIGLAVPTVAVLDVSVLFLLAAWCCANKEERSGPPRSDPAAAGPDSSWSEGFDVHRRRRPPIPLSKNT